jgi:prefoldin subunit 5
VLKVITTLQYYSQLANFIMTNIENLRLERSKFEQQLVELSKEIKTAQNAVYVNGWGSFEVETLFTQKAGIDSEIEGINQEIERLTCIEAVERAEKVEFFSNPILRKFYKTTN